MTQENEIKAYLLTGKGLTSLQAIARFGCTRLAARICDLRSEGWRIQSATIQVTNRYGHNVNVAKYWMTPDAIAEMKH